MLFSIDESLYPPSPPPPENVRDAAAATDAAAAGDGTPEDLCRTARQIAAATLDDGPSRERSRWSAVAERECARN